MMLDREKVIKGLEEIIDYFFDIYRNDTDSYKCAKAQGYSDCAIDAISMLKEQEEVEPKQGEWIYCEDASGQDGYKCSECGFFEPWYYGFENHNFITEYAYCPSCGKPMQEGR